MIATSTDDFRNVAQKRLPRFLFDYIDEAPYRPDNLLFGQDLAAPII